MSDHIIAVDFDGTLCENAWPGIGPARAGVIDYVLGQQMTKATLSKTKSVSPKAKLPTVQSCGLKRGTVWRS